MESADDGEQNRCLTELAKVRVQPPHYALVVDCALVGKERERIKMSKVPVPRFPRPVFDPDRHYFALKSSCGGRS